MKTRTKTIALIFSLILVTGAATIIVSQTISKDIVEKEICNHLNSAVQSRGHHIETVLTEYKQNVEMMATGNPFRNTVDPSKDYNQSIEQVNRRINTIIQTNEDISRVRVLDKNGIVIASSHTDVGQDKSAKGIFLKGKEGVYISNIHVSEFTENAVISVAAPILVNGEFSGVIVVNFDAEKELFKITTDRNGLGETGEIYLVNKDEYMISPSRFLSLNETFLKQKVETGHSGNEPENVKYLGIAGYEHEVILCKNYLGWDVVRAHTHIPDVGWIVVAEISEEEAFAPVASLTRKMLLLLAILSGEGILLAILLSRTITKRIVKLHHGTEEIEKGNLDYKVGTKARDEIGQLSRAFDDMTADLKKSRAELVVYSKGLEEKVKERTKELDEKVKETEEQKIASLNLLEDVTKTKIDLEKAKEELEETNRKLERSNKELQDFVYIASHDLKEPVRKISAFGNLLKESLTGRLDEDEQENFGFMIDGSTRMQQMIDDLLTYSRVTTKAKPAERVDLNKAIGDIKNVELAFPLEETGGTIHIPEPLLSVQADPSQVHQVLQNLIGNGLKYHRKGIAPEITVRSKRENGNMVRVDVEDNGIGIDEENYDRIFGMFRRLHSKEDYGGTGIGLAVCKKIVERYEGGIGVESTPGAGSRFWFTLPIANDELESRNDKLGGEN
jgi:signal transduction histidine kinase